MTNNNTHNLLTVDTDTLITSSLIGPNITKHYPLEFFQISIGPSFCNDIFLLAQFATTSIFKLNHFTTWPVHLRPVNLLSIPFDLSIFYFATPSHSACQSQSSNYNNSSSPVHLNQSPSQTACQSNDISKLHFHQA